MNPPLGPTARRWLLVLTAAGTALLVMIAWLMLDWRRTPVPPQEREPDRAGEQAAAPSSKSEPHMPVVSDTPRQRPRPQAPIPPVVLAPTPPEPVVEQPAPSLEKQPRFTRTLRMMVGHVIQSPDAGQAAPPR